MNIIQMIVLILLSGCKVTQSPINEVRTASPIDASKFDTFRKSFQKADFSACSRKHGEFVSDQLCVLDSKRKIEILAVLARFAEKLQENVTCNEEVVDSCEMTLGNAAEMLQTDPRASIVYNQVESELGQSSARSLNLITSRDVQNQKIICESSFFGEIQLKEILCKLTLGKQDAMQNCGSICSQDSAGKP